jgi:hypothetical protein
MFSLVLMLSDGVVVCGFSHIGDDSTLSFSSFSLLDPILKGLPYEIEVKGDNPTNADINETLLYSLIGDS